MLSKMRLSLKNLFPEWVTNIMKNYEKFWRFFVSSCFDKLPL